MARTAVVCLLGVAVLVASTLAVSCPKVSLSLPQLLKPEEGPKNSEKVFFGKYISISGSWMLVGAYGATNFKGRAYFFEKVGSAWTYRQTVFDVDGTGGDLFSLYLGLSEDVAAVSSPYHPTFGQNKVGKVTVFVYDGSQWAFQQTLLPPGKRWNRGMSFGYGLGNQGDTIVVGARSADAKDADGNILRDDDGKERGRVGGIFIYNRPGRRAAFELDQIIYGRRSGAQWGDDIVVGGLLPGTGVPKIVVTAPRNPNKQYGAGFVFLRDAASGKWEQAQALVPDESSLEKADKDNSPHHFEGCGVYKNTIVSGGERAPSNVGAKTGAAWVWDYDGATWNQGSGLFPESSGRHGQRLGVSALPSGALIAFVGAWGSTEDKTAKAGATYYYVQCSDGSWSRGGKLALSNPAANDQFGNMVAMDDNFVAVGAPKRDINIDEQAVQDGGAVYVYKFVELGSVEIEPEP